MSEPVNPPPRSRRGLDAWTLTGTALVSVLVVLVNYISARRFERWDLTRDGLFTLSERTINMVEQLDRPVELYVFMGAGEASFQDLRELIERYRSLNSKITAQYVDPDREPARFKLLAEKYGVRAGLQEGGHTQAELALLAVSGERRWSVTRDDLIDLDYGEGPDGAGDKSPKIDVKTEQALSGALLQVTSGRATKVCTSEGHGEWSLSDSADRSLAATKEALKRENVELEAIATRGKSELPKSCDALFVLGPTKPFSEEESALLERYLKAGGNLLLALDPVIDGERVAPSGLESLAGRYGLSIASAVVVERDRERLLTPSPVEALLVTTFGSHVTMRSLAGLGAPIVMQLARPVGATDKKAEGVLSASEQAYGETALGQITAGDELEPGEGDVPAPIQLGVAVATMSEKGAAERAAAKGGRLMLLGDSDWLQADLLHQPQLANLDLLSSITGWLSEREALIDIAPRKIDAQALLISQEGLFGVFLRVVLLMPLAMLVLGVGVWWQRRQ